MRQEEVERTRWQGGHETGRGRTGTVDMRQEEAEGTGRVDMRQEEVGPGEWT